MPTIVTNPGYVAFINTFRCRPDDQAEVVRIDIDIVEQAAAQYDGFTWRTPADLHAMQASPEFQIIAQRFD